MFAGNELVQRADEDILHLPLFRLSQLVQTRRVRPKFPAFFNKCNRGFMINDLSKGILSTPDNINQCKVTEVGLFSALNTFDPTSIHIQYAY